MKPPLLIIELGLLDTLVAIGADGAIEEVGVEEVLLDEVST